MVDGEKRWCIYSKWPRRPRGTEWEECERATRMSTNMAILQGLRRFPFPLPQTLTPPRTKLPCDSSLFFASSDFHCSIFPQQFGPVSVARSVIQPKRSLLKFIARSIGWWFQSVESKMCIPGTVGLWFLFRKWYWAPTSCSATILASFACSVGDRNVCVYVMMNNWINSWLIWCTFHICVNWWLFLIQIFVT